MKKINCNIILCGPAFGKTYLANIDDCFIDIDGIKSNYKYNLQDLDYKTGEKGKGNRGKVINNDSVEYAINLLEEIIQKNKIALISYQEELLNYIHRKNYDYYFIYADIGLREEYKKRMNER